MDSGTCRADSSSSTVARSNWPTSSPVLLAKGSSSLSPSLSRDVWSCDIWWVWSLRVLSTPNSGWMVVAVLSLRDSWVVASVSLTVLSSDAILVTLYCGGGGGGGGRELQMKLLYGTLQNH